MKIISAPHPTLRRVANRVENFDKRLAKFVERLKNNYTGKRSRGVGLAALRLINLANFYSASY